MIKWKWFGIPSWIATHWSRHKWECFISTQRSDKTGAPRNKLPQDAPVNFTGDANAQQLIDTWRKRLCYKASPETRKYAEDFKITLHDIEPEIADVLCPNCVYRCFCPEMESCGWWENYIKDIDLRDVIDGERRYSKYNEYFYSSKK